MDSTNVTAGENATALEYNNLRKDLVLGKALSGDETDEATVTVDASDLTKGKIRDITLGGNRTILVTNAVKDQIIMLRIKQDATGSRVPSWSGSITISWYGGTAPTFTTTANKTDSVALICTNDDGDEFEGYILGMSK
ncbi:hypothetical protein KKB83_04110 [Patescibacteria group bacterium]|nr:hypothetical protein [Patescibacteria group bacterium]